MKIAIVGAGVAGSSVLRTLIDQGPLDQIQAIDVYEYRKETSKGLPYEDDDDALWLNSSADRVSCDPAKPMDFVDWLKDQGVKDEVIQGLVPRPLYGQYLHECFASYFAHDLVTVIQDRVVDFQAVDEAGLGIKADGRQNFSYALKTASHDQWVEGYGAVFFAVGHPPYADYYDLGGYDQFIRQVYPARQQLSALDDYQSIGIIGSGATSFDLLRYLDRHYASKAPWTLYIRTTPFTPTEVVLDGEPHLPSVDEDWMDRHRQPGTFNISLADLYQQVLEDFEGWGVDWKQVCRQHTLGDLSENIRQYFHPPRQLGIVQEYFSYLTPYLPDLYQALSQEDRDAYDRDQRPYVEHFRHVVPRPVMGMILDWLKEDKLRIVPGLSDIQWNEEKTAFDIYINGRVHESSEVLINATGFDLRLNQAAQQDELMGHLYDKHYITPAFKSGEGVSVTWPETQVVSQRFGLLPQVYFMGHFIFPTQYANNNAQLNMKQGRRSAEHLIRQLEA